MAKSGFSLVECLIVIAIITLLVQLALPAIENAREAARQSQCQSNLRQIGLACHTYEATHKYFPSGGWTHHWVSDPNQGFGATQPGGWCYSVLPSLEHQATHDLGLGLTDADRRRVGATMFAVAISTFNCPSRRPVRAWPFVRTQSLLNIDEPLKAGRSDYAANIGNLTPSDQRWLGPETIEDASVWKSGDDPESQWVATYHNGVVYQRSEVSPAMIEDGLSKTYLIGEKFLDPEHYRTGTSFGDDQSLYIGFDRDNARSSNELHPPMQDSDVDEIWLPKGDSRIVTDWNFGSAHPAAFHMLMCDGSVHRVAYDIDGIVHSDRGSRNGDRQDLQRRSP
jgi:prepilin-type N-terminal cleavage/methylation domain-containing protein